jgi:aminomethyltransferase
MTTYEALRLQAAFLDLSGRAAIRVTGEDRARFLHAMSTNHVSGLKPGQGLYAFFLTAQGRIIADCCIYNFGDRFLLDTEADSGPKLMEHLDRFIIADDVELANETGKWSVGGLEGPASLERARGLDIPVPDEQYGVVPWGDGFVARVAATGSAGLRVFVRPQEFPVLIQKLSEAVIPQASQADAEIVRLENGVARYGIDFNERYLVGETGLMHGVHSNKGCYVGQEIVERVRSRAQLHRHLKSLRIEGREVPNPGTKLQLQDKEAGELTSAAFSPALDCVVALGYVRTEALESGVPLVVSVSGAKATIANANRE